MKRIVVAMVCCCASSIAARAADPSADVRKSWPQWRGPNATGVADMADPPIEWSETKNIRWRVEIPGKASATPIIWGDRVYIQTAVKTDKVAEPQQQAAPRREPPTRGRDNGGVVDWRRSETEQPNDPPPRPRGRRGRRGGWGGWRGQKPTHFYKFNVMALDRRSGEVIWNKTVCESVPHEVGHPNSTQASNSPVTDGRHIYAYFGSRGLYCLDMDGNLKWQRDFGDMQTRMNFGEGSSPALYGDTLVVNWDHEGDSFIVALDKKTGQQLWKVDRDEHTSWSTPIVVEDGNRPQVIVDATNFVRSYDLATGKLIWQCSGLTMNVIPTPVSGFGMVYAMSGFSGNALLAIRYGGASGDITGTDAIVWQHNKGTPYVPSPLLYGDTLYFLQRNNAILSCFDAKTGKEHYARRRLKGIEGAFASPVGAHDRVYIAGRNGTTLVIKRGPTFEIMATNSLDDGFDASPAIVEDELYLRGHKYLYCISAKKRGQVQSPL